MSGPITNYELGKSTHREYEAQVSGYWGQGLAEDGASTLTEGSKLPLALSSATAVILLIVGILAF
jgi:hypothetical protein